MPSNYSSSARNERYEEVVMLMTVRRHDTEKHYEVTQVLKDGSVFAMTDVPFPPRTRRRNRLLCSADQAIGSKPSSHMSAVHFPRVETHLASHAARQIARSATVTQKFPGSR
ncbi:hypothetical protein SNOG_01104 [Parastagonospora nodorum SN15]|uniref:Uncharacterized protein n=1 Tax=Phaeosphaeria nodorum (strain SN15 / ATCC MYA-4574 / FGSC 10173) TaxID=321614 RepID=Q0V4G0_PHANO|nr:hypothetical protein SNOG_01104 [Parastagonospora nodorum SN15]EAT92599.1 hypothetical protein SNOG_01104 [Parastagonospora nodorum SN15]